jgi:hypothetical protein
MLVSSPPRSKRTIRGDIYAQIIEAAAPGDLVFFISEKPVQSLSWPTWTYRRWLGFSPEDRTQWHTAIYVGAKRENKSRWYRPHIVHAASSGVIEGHIPATFFTSTRQDDGALVQRARIEVLSNQDLSSAMRAQIVEHCRSRIGMPFSDMGWRNDLVTYLLGLPAPRRTMTSVSCQALAYDAYGSVGLTFPHQLHSAPALLARRNKCPWGHPADHVDLSRLYLRDHHLYRDQRFDSVLAVFEDETSGPQVVWRPGKYSWRRQVLVLKTDAPEYSMHRYRIPSGLRN